MNRTFFFSITMFLGSSLIFGIAPYIQIAKVPGTIWDARDQVVSFLEKNAYDMLGEYQPGDIQDIYVLAFTNQDLIELCQKSGGQGMLAAAMKVGFQKAGNEVTISILNPEYLFYAYFRERMKDTDFQAAAISLSDAIKKDLEAIGSLSIPFGGDESPEDLVKYRYMAGMPTFEKQVELAEFESFTQGIEMIRKNLAAGKGNTATVYEMVDEDASFAVFGVALSDPEEGEAHFLPIIGESHVAAMPYELILMGKEATMLHGRFRFALHWPDLTMGTFTKILSAPGDVEDAMKSLVE